MYYNGTGTLNILSFHGIVLLLPSFHVVMVSVGTVSVIK